MDSPVESGSFQTEREAMVRAQLADRGIADVRVLGAMRHVPRHQFVDRTLQSSAYEDHPLPIGAGQTISQPYIVALMLEYLALQPEDRVLEVGTGSGYVTALLGTMCREVYSIERHTRLAAAAEATLERLGYTNVKIRVGDGSLGWSEFAPYDSILVSAAAETIPPALLEQLREGGRMVVPVGPPMSQFLHLVRKVKGQTAREVLEGCRFVPLVEGELDSE